jgi:cellulose synthase/poly-beta-1,6-N-acetylglucosamine synthase-like glycosyltransferase
MLEVLFWLLIGLVLWTYVGYPLLLAFLALFRRRHIVDDPIEPRVTLIITAYNEETSIGSKLDNCLLLDYPRDKLQILVASDCSDDGTHEIVNRYADEGVELMALPHRGGKTAAQNEAVKQSRGDIIVFTDASTEFTPEMLRELTKHFSDERVGCVGAELEYVSDLKSGIGKGAGAYWRYEKRVKSMESAVNSLIGVSGCLYAVRRHLYTDIAPDMISDFVIASDVYEKGFITVYGRGVVSKEKTLESTQQEFNMRVRVAIRSINALLRYSRMLNPFKHGLFSIQILSHKVLRYLVPELLIALLATHVSLVVLKVESPVPYDLLLVAHLSVYGLAFLGWIAHALAIRIPGLHIPFYFMQVNVAALWALISYIRGERKTIWTPIR